MSRIQIDLPDEMAGRPLDPAWVAAAREQVHWVQETLVWLATPSHPVHALVAALERAPERPDRHRVLAILLRPRIHHAIATGHVDEVLHELQRVAHGICL